MNRHFEDAWYHAKRAGRDLSTGVRETLTPVKRTVEERLGKEPEPEPTRYEKVRDEVTAYKRRVERAVRRSRERLRA